MPFPFPAVAMALAALVTPEAPLAAATDAFVQSPRSGRPAVRPGQRRVNLPGPRWGGRVQGRWYGGQYAPGGWAAYRVPIRGAVLPRYWIAPSFHIPDWSTYGLVQPMPGYDWYRYYDDAVLADRAGRVFDHRSDIDWDARDDGRYVRDDDADDVRYRGEGPVARRDDGVGGAVIGGVAGAVAGNVIAGRGNRLGGTALGAGVGALAGTAIDRAEDRGRDVPQRYDDGYDGYGASYPVPGDDVPVAPDDGDPYDRRGPDIVYAPYREQVQPTGRAAGPVRGGYVETVRSPGYSTTTTHSGGGYVADGYYYPPATVTTVTVGSPVITTTTTEEVVTYSTPRTVRRRAPVRSKTLCRC